MKKRRKINSGEYAVVLVSGLETIIDSTERLFRDSFSSIDLVIPSSLRSETAMLMVSAFDAGIVSGNESQLRESIRSYFHALSGGFASSVSARIAEYALAIEGNTGSSKYLENIGHVFASIIGNGNADVHVAAIAASSWANTYKMVVDLLNKEIGSIEYVPYNLSSLKGLLDGIVKSL